MHIQKEKESQHSFRRRKWVWRWGRKALQISEFSTLSHVKWSSEFWRVGVPSSQRGTRSPGPGVTLPMAAAVMLSRDRGGEKVGEGERDRQTQTDRQTPPSRGSHPRRGDAQPWLNIRISADPVKNQQCLSPAQPSESESQAQISPLVSSFLKPQENLTPSPGYLYRLPCWVFIPPPHPSLCVRCPPGHWTLSPVSQRNTQATTARRLLFFSSESS